MQLINNVLVYIAGAKEKIIRELIEKVECRPATLQDAENVILVTHSLSLDAHRQRVIYRDIQLGDIEVDMVGMVVRFIPICEIFIPVKLDI
jgi:hypothetical protein